MARGFWQISSSPSRSCDLSIVEKHCSQLGRNSTRFVISTHNFRIKSPGDRVHIVQFWPLLNFNNWISQTKKSISLLFQQYSAWSSHCWEVNGAVGIPLRFISLSCAVSLLRTPGLIVFTAGFQSLSANALVLAQILVWCVYLFDTSLQRHTSAPKTLSLFLWSASCSSRFHL